MLSFGVLLCLLFVAFWFSFVSCLLFLCSGFLCRVLLFVVVVVRFFFPGLLCVVLICVVL